MIEQRFFEKVKYSEGCWEWIACKDSKGYGNFWVNNTVVKAQRWAYEYFREPLGELYCCHECDNPSCVNPFHLYAGTNADNTRDRDLKGRQWNTAKTQCKHGHPFDEINTGFIRSTGYRYCKKCKKIRDHKRTKAFKEGEI